MALGNLLLKAAALALALCLFLHSMAAKEENEAQEEPSVRVCYYLPSLLISVWGVAGLVTAGSFYDGT